MKEFTGEAMVAKRGGIAGALLQNPFMGDILSSVEYVAHKNQGRIDRYGYWGLIVFVWIPFMASGVLVGAMVAPLTLTVLNEAFRITPTYCAAHPPANDPTCKYALEAPQAEIIGTLIEGLFGGSVNYPMLALGALIAAIIIWRGLPVMSVAIGMYLPIYLSATIFLGGILNHLVVRSAHYRIDGTLAGVPSDAAAKAGESISSRGLLLSAGMIAGEALMGVLVAFCIREVLPEIDLVAPRVRER